MKSTLIKSASIMFANQVIAILGIIAVSRYYNPSDFGIFSIVQLTSIVIGGIVSLRLELAVPLASSKQDVSKLLYSWFITVFIFMSIFVLLYLIIDFLGLDIAIFKWAIVLGGFIASFNLTISVLTWRGMYLYSSFLILCLSVLIIIFQIYFATIKGGLGLIYGVVVANGFIFLICTYIVLNNVSVVFFGFQTYTNTLKKNKSIITYSSLSGLVFTISSNWPIVILTYFFGTHESGLFSMAKKVFDSLTKVIDGGLKNIFYGEYSRTRRYSKFLELIKYFYVAIVVLSILIYIFAYLYLEQLISLFLGVEWVGLKDYIIYLIPLFIGINSVVIGKIILLAERENKFLFKVDISLLVIRTFLLTSPIYLFNVSSLQATLLFSLSSLMASFFIYRKSSNLLISKIKATNA